MSLKDLQKIIRIMRKEGVLKIKMSDLELELSEIIPVYEKKINLPKLHTTPEPIINENQYSEMDTLLWSVQGHEEVDKAI